MSTNLLAMPMVQMTVITGNNEDWVDSIVYLVDGEDPETTPQLDLNGIEFSMEVRRQPSGSEVVIRAHNDENHWLQVGEPPNNGYLLINVPWEQMKLLVKGTYFGDIVGRDEISTRRVVTIELQVEEGITRP